MTFRRVRRKALALKRRFRTVRLLAKAFHSPHHPILAQIVPTRRCNLSCAYCSEFDKVSEPVQTDVMLRRIDRLAALGTTMIDLSGGEPMLHPDLDEIIRRVRHHGMLAGLLTNGYLLTCERIRRLNRAGLDRLQISIDNVLPDRVSHKSLKVLDQKLRWLADDAQFDVNINTVLGAGVSQPWDALVIARRALELGFGTSVGLVHDGSGRMLPLDADERRLHEEISLLGRNFYSHAHDGRVSRESDRRTPEHVALSGRSALLVRVRRRARALVLAAARPSCDSAQGLRRRGSRARVRVAEIVRAVLHDFMRSPRGGR